MAWGLHGKNRVQGCVMLEVDTDWDVSTVYSDPYSPHYQWL